MSNHLNGTNGVVAEVNFTTEVSAVKKNGVNGDASKRETSSTSSDSDVGADSASVDLRYGCFGTRPSWLQWLNNIVGAVTFISLANLLQSLANALYGVELSTIERQFDLTSSQSSWIAVGYEIGPIPVLILVSVLGNRIHRPISISLGLITIGLGCILFFIPQFTTPANSPTSSTADGLCGSNVSLPQCEEDGKSLSSYLVVFIVARVLIGMGATPILTLGVNYMDDCSPKEKFAKYCGIFMAMIVIGPGIGFIVGALTLNIFTDFYLFSKDEIAIDPSDPNWIGCWWLPYTVTAGLCLVLAMPIWGYPHDLPGAAEIRAKKVTEAHKDDRDVTDSAPSSQLSYAKTCSEFGTLAKGVLTNPTYLALTLFTSCDNFILAGFTAFGPKYFEFGFAMSPTVAGLMFGVVLLPAGACGTIIGGIVIEKFRLTCRQIIRLQTVLAGCIAVGCVLFLLVCDSSKFAGVNEQYNRSLSIDAMPLDLLASCNANCSCDEVIYEPICSHDKVQYFSPCHAGCEFRNKSADGYDYYSCSCLPASDFNGQPMATSGQCSSGICTEAIIFLVGFFIAVFAIFVCMTTTTSATLRCVTSQQTSFALGVQVLVIKLLGTIPGPLLMGIAFDNTCLLWQSLPCSDVSGSCVFYDNNALSKNFLVLMCSMKVISFIAMVLAVIMYQPPHVVTDQSVVMEVKLNSVDISSTVINDEKLAKSILENNSRTTYTNGEDLGDRHNDFETVRL